MHQAMDIAGPTTGKSAQVFTREALAFVGELEARLWSDVCVAAQDALGAAAHLPQAIAILDDLVEQDAFVDFLTLPAYQALA